ncbi:MULTISPECIES: hypothetical protein [Clostridium]|jgi:hypothetical protein|uniref:Lipopolysaccharide export LptBFGC system permease protein LptF n=2 Tax=Clostridium beijerinckii TaxID=1520 RepID=A0AAE5LQP6_CLOBE|nr:MULTISPECIES: hypothetical protein [Clostridium]ABR34459.1 hypothetical protein Cbei_2299 [Clostridium beijerinckii NCIMB 8052]AIU04976.1 hypothetical protein Cbs_2299 [Clostridium beijerinckii ATCC 35702]AVK51267.1 hypothetical protein AXY43_26445 [Clostridium sp. MF28]MBF7810919.1 hypothetical protein [Clostridium beijerinckii]NOW91648.1 lipopolysaccharide export LptBFGC system permease protein LptF [Clostridium beijerinckii]
MARRKTSKVPKNDFEYDEGEVYGFTSETPIAGDCISSFSFDDDSNINIIQNSSDSKSNNTVIQEDPKTNTQANTASTINSNFENNITNSLEIKNTLSSTKELFDNRRTPLPNGATPAIDGETPNIKRSYTLRSSTIRKINELKSIHPDINVCVSTIVDIAINYYHNHIANEGGTQ